MYRLASKARVAVIASVVAVTATGLYYYMNTQHRRETEERTLRDRLERERLIRRDSEAERHLNELMARVESEFSQEVEQDERLHQSKMLAIQSDAEGHVWEMIENEKRYQSESERLKQAADTRLEKLKEKAMLTNLRRDQRAQMEQSYSEQANKAELAQMQRESESDLLKFKDDLNEYNSRFQQAKVRQAEQESIRRREDERDEERFQERLRRLQEQLNRDLEEMRSQDSARRREMEYQLSELQRQIRMKVWSMEIENNWTRRLNALRSSYESVRNSWKTPSEKPQILKVQLEHAKKAVEIQRALMVNEANAMEEMYRDTGKEFLKVIKDAVEEVKEECDRVEYALTSSPPDVLHINQCFSRLSQASMRIPTLAELKKLNEQGN